MWAIIYHLPGDMKKSGKPNWRAYGLLYSSKGAAGTYADKLKERGYEAFLHYIHFGD